MSGPHTTRPVPALPPLRTLDDVRAALRSGRGFPDDPVSFEADLQRALEASSETDLSAVARVIVDCRGRIRLRQVPDFETPVQEGMVLTERLKLETDERRAASSRPDGRADRPDQESIE